MSTRTRRLLAGLLTLLLTVGSISLAVNLADSDGDGRADQTNISVTLGGPGREQVTLPPVAQAVAASQAAQAADGDAEAAHSDLAVQPAASGAASVVRHNLALTPTGIDPFPSQVPLAAAHTGGCRTMLVRNYSSRNGATVLLGVVHLTASQDHGWDGVLGNVRWFDNPSSQASSHYIIDRKIGACALTVPESQTAWTQAGFNRWAVSVEVTATGAEPSLVEGAGRDRLVQLLRRWHRVYKLPYRIAQVDGCRVVRSGFLRHVDLGQCGGGHVDTTPHRIEPYIQEAARLDRQAALRWCGRAHERRGDGKAPERRAKARERGFRCSGGKPLAVAVTT